VNEKTKCESCGTVIWRTPGTYDKPEAIWSEDYGLIQLETLDGVPITRGFASASTEHTPDRCRAKRGLT
jgi:hypothetical protein